VDDLQLLFDLYKGVKRQGPGGEVETKKAIDLAMLDPSAPLKVADIGCGTGASTVQLAHLLNAKVTAIDFSSEFIEVLKGRAENEGLSEKINAVVCSMENLPFDGEEYDVIWSEGAIYNIGFERGVRDWKRFLKPGGLLAVSEITWTISDRPSEIQKYWDAAYPEIDTASSKISILEKSGYSPVAYFVLPEHCWLENYYRPLQNSFSEFVARNANNENAQALVSAEREEISLYEKFKEHYSYGFYIARKLR